ncbi:MAG: hypothetical protein ABDH20_01045 [Thermus sp.]
MGKALGVRLLKPLLLPLFLCLFHLLSAQGSLLPPAPVDLPPGDGGRWLLVVRPGERVEFPVRLAPGAQGARVALRLADPCARGRARCPGWDASRYPWVEHTREAFTLTPASPEARFAFRVDPEAPSQGPLKWEAVVRDGGREWVYPLYLRVRGEGMTGLEALAAWRERAGLPPLLGEDLEEGWGGWLHGRYEVANGNQAPPHDEDPSHPFHTPEGQAAAGATLATSWSPWASTPLVPGGPAHQRPGHRPLPPAGPHRPRFLHPRLRDLQGRGTQSMGPALHGSLPDQRGGPQGVRGGAAPEGVPLSPSGDEAPCERLLRR